MRMIARRADGLRIGVVIIMRVGIIMLMRMMIMHRMLDMLAARPARGAEEGQEHQPPFVGLTTQADVQVNVAKKAS